MNEDDQKSQTDVAPLDGAVHETDVQLLRRERASLAQVKPWFLGMLSRKNLLALTGLFLCFFLVIHLFGNLQLLLPAEVAHWQFNFYSKLLSENIFIELISYVLFARILAHAAQMDREGFGHCSNTEACQVECPQETSVLHIAGMNWEYNRALLS